MDSAQVISSFLRANEVSDLVPNEISLASFCQVVEIPRPQNVFSNKTTREREMGSICHLLRSSPLPPAFSLPATRRRTGSRDLKGYLAV
jgi:hypothetical protein